MSLLREIYATPGRVKAVVQLLAATGGGHLQRDTAEHLLSPPSLRTTDDDEQPAERAMAKAVVNECIALRLVVVDGSSLSIGSSIPKSAQQAQNLAGMLPGIILDSVVDLDNQANVHLANALAWYLGQDVLRAAGTWREFGAALEDQNARDTLPFNDNVYQMFEYWSRYLGLARGLALGGADQERRLAPDPTPCIRRLLSEILKPHAGPQRLTRCMATLAVQCPLFEGGSIRKEVDRISPRRELRHLSTTTSHALLRLEEESTIALAMKSDADALILMDGEQARPVSDVSWVAGGEQSR